MNGAFTIADDTGVIRRRTPCCVSRLAGRRGFTLVELMVVVGIMVLMMGLSVVGYLGIRRGAEMRGAAASVRTTLMLSRQLAISQRKTVKTVFVTDGATNRIDIYILPDEAAPFRKMILPRGVQFTDAPTNLMFYPAGTAGAGGQSVGTEDITIKERAEYAADASALQQKKIRVWLLTGITKEE